MEDQKLSKFLILYQEMNHDLSPSEEQVKEAVRGHVENLKDLDSKGVLFLCGPLKRSEGGMFILKARTYEEAEGFVKKDPFIANEFYKKYVIHEIIEANAGNGYLFDNH
jgi:uncharacterized protein YciI